ncbi:unnamed protein product [Rotaria sp. Silwood1]|nr:unnamed protein product [Rotaria sp. Silwood1]
MDKLYGTVCYSIRLLTLYSGVLIVSTFFIIGIILKSIAAPDYVNERRTREFYTNTSCLLLNYTFVIRECQSCAQYSCSTYSCLDEQFFMSYIIFNGTLVNSTFVIYGKATSHKQIQIGIHYPCFYKQANVTSVVWNVPDGKSFVIQLNIFFGIVGLGLDDQSFFNNDKNDNIFKDVRLFFLTLLFVILHPSLILIMINLQCSSAG